jgi:hypothetical protein
MKRIAYPSVLAAVVVAGCGSDPVDVTGEYNVNVVNRDNGCEFEDWDGGSAQDIPVTITQDGESATARVEGLTGNYLDLILGGHEFNGTVDGNDLSLTLIGERSATQGNCAYTFDAVIDASLDGNTLEGTISYEARTNGQPDCGNLTGCASVQELNGLRPPPN